MRVILVHIQALALTDCLRYRGKRKTRLIPVILNAALSDGLGVGGSAARHTSQGAFLAAEVQGSVK